MSMISHLKKMIDEPASKEWFKKYGTPKGKALKKVAKHLSPEEQKEKMKSWPTGHGVSQKQQMHRSKQNREYQNKIGRAWNE